MKDAQKDQTDTEEIDIRKLLTLCNDFFQLFGDAISLMVRAKLRPGGC
jgi:hypothetical protein